MSVPRTCVRRRGTDEYYDGRDQPPDAWDPEDWEQLQPEYERVLKALRRSLSGLYADHMAGQGYGVRTP